MAVSTLFLCNQSNRPIHSLSKYAFAASKPDALFRVVNAASKTGLSLPKSSRWIIKRSLSEMARFRSLIAVSDSFSDNSFASRYSNNTSASPAETVAVTGLGMGGWGGGGASTTGGGASTTGGGGGGGGTTGGGGGATTTGGGGGATTTGGGGGATTTGGGGGATTGGGGGGATTTGGMGGWGGGGGASTTFLGAATDFASGTSDRNAS